MSHFLTLVIVVAIVFLSLSVFITVFIIIYQRKQLTFKKTTEELKSIFQQTLLQSQLEIKEQTLQYLSYEIHDNLGQVASLIKINLNTLQLNNSQKSIDKLEDTKELMRQLISDLKGLSRSLGAERITQNGLANALRIEVDRLNKTGHFIAVFEQAGEIPDLDSDKIIILYRMTQESLNNIVKHSNAKAITVSLISTENDLRIKLVDDGVGFNVEEKKKSGGAGLLNLEDRARLIQAKLIIRSSAITGTEVMIVLPLVRTSEG